MNSLLNKVTMYMELHFKGVHLMIAFRWLDSRLIGPLSPNAIHSPSL